MAKKPVRITDYDMALKAGGVRIKYAPRGASKELFHRRDEEVLLAGPAGTGKSLSILHKMHLAMGKYKDAKAFMARKTRNSMTNSCLDMFQRHVLKRQDRVHLHKTDQQFQYPNGSIIAIVGLDDPERIKSSEWDMGYIQEATECTENDWEMCTSRLRNMIMPYQQMLGDCNPDRPTHWLKKRAEKGLTLLLQSFHKDNPRLWAENLNDWTPEGKIYIGKLMRLSGVRFKRLYQGLWAAAEGVVYEDWDPLVHQISVKELPKGWEAWTHYWSIDWGYIHPFVWQDWIENPHTGQIYRLKEIYKTRMLVEDLARFIKDQTKDLYTPRAIICDHDLEDRMVLERHTGYPTIPAFKAIQPGIQAVQRRLRKDWCKDGPGIFYVRDGQMMEPDQFLQDAGDPTCTEEEFEGYVWDKKLNELVNSKKDELPIDKNNHGMDGTRYQVAFQDSLADDPAEFESILTLGEDIQISIY